MLSLRCILRRSTLRGIACLSPLKRLIERTYPNYIPICTFFTPPGGSTCKLAPGFLGVGAGQLYVDVRSSMETSRYPDKLRIADHQVLWCEEPRKCGSNTTGRAWTLPRRQSCSSVSVGDRQARDRALFLGGEYEHSRRGLRRCMTMYVARVKLTHEQKMASQLKV